MAWLLSEAVLRCQGRRLRGLFGRSPVVASCALAAFLGAPFAAALASSAAAETVAAALARPDVARLLVLSLALPALAAGAAIARTVPGPATLGAQLGSAPVHPVLLVAVAALPAALAVLALAPLATAAVLPFASAAPGGSWSAAATLSVVVAALAAGAAGSELGSSALRGSRTALLALLALIAAIVLVSRCGWPVDAAAAALAGRSGALAPSSSGVAASLLLSALWLLARRHRPAATRGRRPTRLRAPISATPLAAHALLVLGRRADTRGALVAAALFGLAGVAAGRLAGLDAAFTFALGLSSAVASGVLAPLAVGGAALGCRWLLRGCPRTPLAVAAAWGTSSALLFTAALAPLVAASPIVGGPPVGALRTIATTGALAVGSALLAGSIVPWRPSGLGDQLASLGALAAVGSAGIAATVAGVEWGDRVGLGDALATVLVAALVVAAGVAACARRVGLDR